MSKSLIETVETPVSAESNKRQLSSPFDPNDLKKARALSFTSNTSDMEGSDTTENVMHLSLQDEDLVKISNILKGSFEAQLSSLVSNIVDGVLHGLHHKIETLETENIQLKAKVQTLETTLDQVNDRQDQAEQYSRRNNLRLSGIREFDDESTDQRVIDIAKAIGSNLILDEIDRSHRLGKPKSSTDKSLTGLLLSGLLFQARGMLRNGRISGTWTSNGVIIIKGKDDRKHRIETQKDLDTFKLKNGIID